MAAPDDVATLFDRARQEMGPLAALVNNAGITGEQKRIDEQDADKLARLMQINVVGPMVCAKHAVQAMSTAHGGAGGSIVNIASVAAQAPPDILGLVTEFSGPANNNQWFVVFFNGRSARSMSSSRPSAITGDHRLAKFSWR